MAEFKAVINRFEKYYGLVEEGKANPLFGGIIVTKLRDYILKNKDYLNVQDRNGNTLLHHCFAKAPGDQQGGSACAAGILISLGADKSINTYNNNGETPIDICKREINLLAEGSNSRGGRLLGAILKEMEKRGGTGSTLRRH